MPRTRQFPVFDRNPYAVAWTCALKGLMYSVVLIVLSRLRPTNGSLYLPLYIRR
jgi:hypothetical protein